MTNSDFPRNNLHCFVIELQTPAGEQIGNLFGTLLGSGNAAPGAPAGGGNWAVLGGSGAYIGVRGQGSNVAAANCHTTTMKEDTAARRTNSSGQIDYHNGTINDPPLFRDANGVPIYTPVWTHMLTGVTGAPAPANLIADMIRFDIRYAKRMSMWAEIQMLFKTFPATAQQIRDHRSKRHETTSSRQNRSGKENA